MGGSKFSLVWRAVAGANEEIGGRLLGGSRRRMRRREEKFG